MIQQAWDQTSQLLEKRFLTNAFLPVLLFAPAVVATGLGGTGQLSDQLRTLHALDIATRLVLLAGYLLAVWFLASFVQSHWRNLIRLFEGYPLRSWRSLDQAAKGYHRQRMFGLEKTGPAHVLYYGYPRSSDDVMATRLGNVLRAAERYGNEHYGADTILAWPRLAALLPSSYSAKVEEFRAALEFQLVVCTWCALYTAAAATWLVIADGSVLLFLAVCILGLSTSYLSYIGGVTAAAEYGEQLRSGMDLYRTRVFKQLRLPLPDDLQSERAQWQAWTEFVMSDPETDIVWAPGESGVSD